DAQRPKRRKFTKGNLLFSFLLAGAAGTAALLGILFIIFDVAMTMPVLIALSAVVVQLTVLAVKFAFVFWFFIWVRWTVPRLRYDHLVALGWKVLVPAGLLNIAVTAALVLMGWL